MHSPSSQRVDIPSLQLMDALLPQCVDIPTSQCMDKHLPQCVDIPLPQSMDIPLPQRMNTPSSQRIDTSFTQSMETPSAQRMEVSSARYEDDYQESIFKQFLKSYVTHKNASITKKKSKYLAQHQETNQLAQHYGAVSHYSGKKDSLEQVNSENCTLSYFWPSEVQEEGTRFTRKRICDANDKVCSGSFQLRRSQLLDQLILCIVARVELIACDRLNLLSQSEVVKLEASFNLWQSTCDKSALAHYNNSSWCAIYVRKLFAPRILSIWFAMAHIFSKSKLRKELTKVHRACDTVVSIGCGPGPCTVAFVAFLRRCLGCTQHLRVLNVDQCSEWYSYVASTKDLNCLGSTSVDFLNLHVDEASLNGLPDATVLLMCYTFAQCRSTRFWQVACKKYDFILVIDQNPALLADRLTEGQFHSLRYKFFDTYQSKTVNRIVFYHVRGSLR